MKTYFLMLSICLMALSSCSQGIATSTTVKDAVIDYYENVYNWKGGETTDQRAFIHYNRAEILNTLEIAEVKNLEEKDIAIAFTRFSIGSIVVRKAIWFRKVEGIWAKMTVPPQHIGIEYIGFEEHTPELSNLFSKIEHWEEDNPKVWWLTFWN